MHRRPVVLSAILLTAACSAPPQKEIDRAQGAIDAARAAGAETYAPAEFSAATSALQQAHEAVAQRDYRLALSRALDAGERAQDAARQAADGKAHARSEAEAAVAALATSLQQLQSTMKTAASVRVPPKILASAKQTAARAQGSLQEARTRLEAERYLEVARALGDANRLIAEQILALNQAIKTRPARRPR